jgi:hypothetical protein
MEALNVQRDEIATDKHLDMATIEREANERLETDLQKRKNIRAENQMKREMLPIVPVKVPSGKNSDTSILLGGRKRQRDEKKSVTIAEPEERKAKIARIRAKWKETRLPIQCKTCKNPNAEELALCKGCYSHFFCNQKCQHDYFVKNEMCSKE